MQVLFCHGLESGPWGRKSIALRDAGLEVIAPDGRGQDLAARVDAIAQAIADAPAAPLVVGSSFGGIAGLVAAIVADARGARVRGLVLLAPALFVPAPPILGDRPLRPPAPTLILHGTRDDICPIEVSRRFAAEHGARLIEVDDDHRLVGSLPRIVDAVRGAIAGEW